jgi:hypothetical protein
MNDDSVWYQIKELENQLWNKFWIDLNFQLQFLLWSQIKVQIYEDLGDPVGFNLTQNIMDQLKYENQ